jgi:hypothetical protein
LGINTVGMAIIISSLRDLKKAESEDKRVEKPAGPTIVQDLDGSI